MFNTSIVTEFQLLGFSKIQELQTAHFVMFLAIYLVALMDNFLIIIVIVLNPHLHTPMYFFLVNLSVADFGAISVTIPKSMTHIRTISYTGCAAQVFFLIFFMAVDVSLLTVMAYDRFAAICDPLHYAILMSRESCVKMAIIAWVSGFLYGLVHVGGTFSITFCSNVVNQFFCEIPQILRLSCSDLYLIEIGILVFSAFLVFSCFIFIIISYVQIFRAVMKIPSMKGRQKAFSTCLPHLIVVSLFICICAFAYLKPISRCPSDFDLVATVIYCSVPFMMNPIIYSIRNKDIQTALWKLLNHLNFWISNKMIIKINIYFNLVIP
ncbi:olfactory receptor 14A16-like [Ahaetulla prasina]|uniref:olfactory receptor 14A16-like n=1 Tax=Ahaetulla prasina TaxID=499056 RepID=UPI002647A425|nr:olfactory receptor 14A16-like [Ahaetulla prasina]